MHFDFINRVRSRSGENNPEISTEGLGWYTFSTGNWIGKLMLYYCILKWYFSCFIYGYIYVAVTFKLSGDLIVTH